jgi:hypothetical protein
MKKAPYFEKIYQASFYLLPYRLEGLDLVSEQRRFRLILVNGYQFPYSRFQRLLHPRPHSKDPVKWTLENSF